MYEIRSNTVPTVQVFDVPKQTRTAGTVPFKEVKVIVVLTHRGLRERERNIFVSVETQTLRLT